MFIKKIGLNMFIIQQIDLKKLESMLVHNTQLNVIHYTKYKDSRSHFRPAST